ncbi:MAG: extracellular solute-binding protein, partial [Clostridia bacterium]
NGPDLTDDFSSNVGKFAGVGVMEPLDDYIAKTGFALDDFVPAAVESCRMDGKLYAMPLNINFMGLYYNKTLLKEAGYDAPP